MSTAATTTTQAQEAPRVTIITVNIDNTVGQASAIEANGGPIFEIEVTHKATTFIDGGGLCHLLGFGKVVSEGPVKGHEIGFRTDSVVL